MTDLSGTDLSALSPGTWTVDPVHSTVGFVARHLMISKVRGRFTEFSGSLEVAPEPAAVERRGDREPRLGRHR